jgi:rubrerythrin
MYAREAAILKTAIINELEGYEFYRMAADKAVDGEVKEVFIGLAGEEEKHAQWLKLMYKQVIESKTPAAGEFSLDHAVSPGVFTKNKLKEAGGMVVSALHAGVMMEKASMDYYRDAAAKTGIEFLKKLYLALAAWEQKHLEELEQAYDFAKEEWWEKQGFSPA